MLPLWAVASSVSVASLAFTAIASVPGALVGLRSSHPGGSHGLRRPTGCLRAGSTIGSGRGADHAESLAEQLTEFRRPGVPARAADPGSARPGAAAGGQGQVPGQAQARRVLRLPS